MSVFKTSFSSILHIFKIYLNIFFNKNIWSLRIANIDASTILVEIFSIDNHKWLCFLGNNFIINDIKYFKNGKISKTVTTLNDTAKIDNHSTLSTHILVNARSNKVYVINPNTVEKRLKKKWLYATCFFK